MINSHSFTITANPSSFSLPLYLHFELLDLSHCLPKCSHKSPKQNILLLPLIFQEQMEEFQRRHHHYQTLHLVQKLGHQSSPYNLPDPLWQRKSQQRNKVMHQVEKNKLLAKNAFNESAGKMKIMTKKEMFNLSRKLLRKPWHKKIIPHRRRTKKVMTKKKFNLWRRF